MIQSNCRERIRELKLTLAKFGEALFFPRDGLGIDEPLRFAGAAGLLLFDTAEAANFQKTADFGARGVEKGGGFLGGKPPGIGLRHLAFSSEVGWGGQVHCNGSVAFLATKKAASREKRISIRLACECGITAAAAQ